MATVGAAENAHRKSKIVDLLLSQIVPLAASSIMTLATAMILGASGRGELALILSGGGLLGAVGFLSLHVGIVRAQRDGDRTASRRGFWIAAAIALGIFAGGLGVALVAPSVKLGLFNRTTIFLIALGGALVLFNLVVLRTRQGLGDSRVFRNSWFLQSILFPILGIPVAIVTHSSTLVAICWYLALATSTLYGVRAHTPRTPPLNAGITVPARRIIVTSLPAHAGTVGQQLLFRGDVVVLGFLVSASSVGIYSIAMPIAGLIWVFSEALSLLAFDSGSRHQTASERQQNRRKLVRSNFLYGGVGALFVGLASWLLLPIFLPQFIDAVPLILILLPGVLIQGWARIGLSSLLTTGAIRAPIVIGLASAALSVLYIPFVLAWGILGAAIASTVIYALQTIVVLLVTRSVNRYHESKERSDE